MEKEIQNQTKKDVKMVRYADDFVIMHESMEVIQRAKGKVEKYLEERGLEINQKKTRIIHTSKRTEEKAGLRFLGFEVRTQEKEGKVEVSCQPRREKIGSLMEKLKKKKKPEENEAIIRGWKRYYQT